MITKHSGVCSTQSVYRCCSAHGYIHMYVVLVPSNISIQYVRTTTDLPHDHRPATCHSKELARKMVMLWAYRYTAVCYCRDQPQCAKLLISHWWSWEPLMIMNLMRVASMNAHGGIANTPISWSSWLEQLQTLKDACELHNGHDIMIISQPILSIVSDPCWTHEHCSTHVECW